ncbi:unnamed protein product [Toxocara canis]|uniref:Serine protease K12H4.7 n=1 Tax=Toxocara canis TaxID=6265 RepID=A0A3P7G905_TOXCA|nr:unnamed protein product [Toxocara canis]
MEPRLNETQLRYKDIQYFFSVIYGNFQGAVQYSDDNVAGYRRGGNIRSVCAIMTNSSLTYLDRIQQVNIYMTEFFGQPFYSTFNDYDELIRVLQDETYDIYGEDAAFRSWIWQTCTEFGYFQSTDQGRNIFGSVTPDNLYIDMCIDAFGSAYKVQAIENSIHKTNKYYGGRAHFKGTNVVLINGNVDPWHALGLYSSIQPSVVPILIAGTAHCADMYADATDDLPSLTAARQTIEDNLNKWINGKAARKATNQMRKLVTKRKPFMSSLMNLQLKPFKEATSETEVVPSHIPKFFMGRPVRGFIGEPGVPSKIVDYPKDFIAGTITMPVDHFDATNTNTFQQRYWYNPQYYKPDGPQFLYIGGESTADIKWVTNPDVQIMSAARKFNAAVYLLEHRYYGESWPTPDQSTENMRFLSSKQALADLAQFIMTMNKQFYANPRWITFGGSYPGMLSAWFRQFYPELSVGALASSAPIEAKVDFYDYLIVVENSLRTYSPKCANNVKVAFDQLHNLSLTPDGRVQLSALFTLRPAWTTTSNVTYVDIQNFFMNMYGHFQSAVQYNNDNRGAYATGGGMRELCGFMMNDAKTPLQNLVDVNVYMTKFFNDGVFEYTDNNYQNYVNYLKDVNAKSSSRSWTYQTCTEFGFYQSTDIGDNIFGSPVPLNFFIDMCTDVFGARFTPQFVFNAVEETQKYYGGRDYFYGTNVLFTNGNIDPWCALSKYDGTGSVTTIMINGTAHCADTYPPREQDAPGLASARQLAEEKIAEWLGT